MSQSIAVAVQTPLIEVRRATNRGRGGRGVFARKNIPRGTLIERMPVLLMPATHVYEEMPDGRVRCPALTWYVFDWRFDDAPKTKFGPDDYVGLALGYGSLYNHAWPANARWERVAPDLLEIAAHRDISAGDEITINYHGEPDDPEPVDF